MNCALHSYKDGSRCDCRKEDGNHTENCSGNARESGPAESDQTGSDSGVENLMMTRTWQTLRLRFAPGTLNASSDGKSITAKSYCLVWSRNGRAGSI